MKLEFIGNESYGGWFTDVDDLNKDSIVYSFGAGNDISWDLEIIKKFGCNVYLFDPDPMAIDYIKTLFLPPELKFIPVGLGTYDGQQRFYDALKPGKVNKSTIKKGSKFSQLPIKKLRTIMEDMGHEHIDVLKMDIEGSEFAVLPQVATLPIRCILVEIHTNFYRYGLKGLRRAWGWAKTKRAILSLTMNGFELAHVRGEDWTFVKHKRE